MKPHDTIILKRHIEDLETQNEVHAEQLSKKKRENYKLRLKNAGKSIK